MKHQVWSEVAGLAKRSLDSRQIDLLVDYRDWLVTEAMTAGALGPGETGRVETRHIGDSLLFGAVMPRVPNEVWDLGSGAGLPGVPLAIMYPEVSFRLVERSGRRSDLLNRVVRILDLPNVEVASMDILHLRGSVDAITSRATMNPLDMARVAQRVLGPGGFALVGGSWLESPTYEGWETVEISSGPLDQAVWILIMRRQ